MCDEDEFGVFDPPPGQTCGAYMEEFFAQSSTGYIDNPVRSPETLGLTFFAGRHKRLPVLWL